MSLDSDFDENKDLWITQLHESLELMSNKMRLLESDLGKVKEADKIVRPSSLREFPLAAAGIISATSSGAGVVGELVLSPDTSTPAGCLPCDGQTQYSAFTYAALFDIIGYNYGGVPGNNTFLTPDLRGRALIGEGTGSGLTNRAQFATGGNESETLSTSHMPVHNHSHSHTVNSHTHTGPSHSHDMGNHVHNSDGSALEALYTPGAGSKGPGLQYAPLTTYSNGALVNTSGPSTNSTGNGGTGNTGSASPGTDTDSTNAGSGSAHPNMQPWAAMSIYIRYAADDAATSQAIPVNWGKVTGTWGIGTASNTPSAAIANTVELIETTDTAPEGTIKLTSSSGANSGSSDRTLTGLVRVPYNFRSFRANALSVRSKVSLTGLAGSSSFTVTLKVNDPTDASSYLSSTYTRTVSESSGTAADSEWVSAELKAEELGPAWKPGYVLRFELIFNTPNSYTNLDIRVGKLEINWR